MTRDPAKYTVGWICAISTEAVAAKLFLDESYGRPESRSANDSNSYELGRVGYHYVVIASLPEGEYGLVTAATVARDMLHTFPNIRIGLLVGVAGGAPSSKQDVRLGDVVINSGTALQYDYGKMIQGRPFLITGHLNRPPSVLLTAVSMLRSDYTIMEAKGRNRLNEAVEDILQRNPGLLETHSRPDETTDRLFRSDVLHSDSSLTCDEAGCSSNVCNLSQREGTRRVRNRTLVHYGTIASANRLMKDAMVRDKMAESHNVLCFEMEAAGLVNHFPCLVIRGICDYSDTHKNKEWQGFASLVAAAYAKDLLGKIPTAVEEERPLADISNIEQTRLTEETKKSTDVIRSRQGMAQVKEWLDPADPSTNSNDARKVRYRGTRGWILKSRPFQEWEAGDRRQLWLHGMQGCGKTVLAYIIMEHVAERTGSEGVTVKFFFDCRDPKKQTVDSMVRGLLYQLYCSGTETESNYIYNSLDKMKGGRPATGFLVNSLTDALKSNRNVSIVLDALDECTTRQELLDWLFGLVKDATLGHVKLMATSRPENELELALRDLVGDDGCLALSSKEIKADIQTYIEGSLKQRPGFRRWAEREHAHILRRISAEVVRKADGMFRFAACLLDSLEKCVDIHSIDDALDSIPQDLADIYEGIFQRLPREGNLRDRIIRLLQFLVYPNERLSLKEAVDIVAVQEHGFKRTYRMPRPEDLKSHCSSFVTVSNGKGSDGDMEAVEILKVAHSSVRDYLLMRQAQFFTKQESYKVIVLTCLQYLKSINLDADPEAIKRDYHLADYAAQYWMEYVRLSEDSDEVVAAASEFLGDKRRLDLWASLYNEPKAEVKGTALYYSCQNNLPRLSQRLIRDRPEDLDAHARGDHGYGYPLQAAAREGHIEIVRLLLDSGADVDNVGGAHGTALQAACRCHRKDVVELLLSYKANPNIQAGRGRNALHAAIIGPRSSVSLPGEDPPAPAQAEDSKEPPKVDVEIVKLLLKHRADPNSTGEHGSALGMALHNNRPDLADLLLDWDANVDLAYIDHTDADGTTRETECTPLFLAVKGGMDSMVQRLLQEGATMDAVFGDVRHNIWETAPLQATNPFGFRKITSPVPEAISTSGRNAASDAAVQSHTDALSHEDRPFTPTPRLVFRSPSVGSAMTASGQSSGHAYYTPLGSSYSSSGTHVQTPDSTWQSSTSAFDPPAEQPMVSSSCTTQSSGYRLVEGVSHGAAAMQRQPTFEYRAASSPYPNVQVSQTAPPAVQPFQAPPEPQSAIDLSAFGASFVLEAQDRAPKTQRGPREQAYNQIRRQRSWSTGHTEEMGPRELQPPPRPRHSAFTSQTEQAQRLSMPLNRARRTSNSPQHYQNSQGYQPRAQPQKPQHRRAVSPGQSYQPNNQVQSLAHGYQTQPNRGQLQTANQTQRAKGQPHHYTNTSEHQTAAWTLEAQQEAACLQAASKQAAARTANHSTAHSQQHTLKQGAPASAASAAILKDGQAATTSSWENSWWGHQHQQQERQHRRQHQRPVRVQPEQQLEIQWKQQSDSQQRQHHQDLQQAQRQQNQQSGIQQGQQSNLQQQHQQRWQQQQHHQNLQQAQRQQNQQSEIQQGQQSNLQQQHQQRWQQQQHHQNLQQAQRQQNQQSGIQQGQQSNLQQQHQQWWRQRQQEQGKQLRQEQRPRQVQQEQQSGIQQRGQEQGQGQKQRQQQQQLPQQKLQPQQRLPPQRLQPRQQLPQLKEQHIGLHQQEQLNTQLQQHQLQHQQQELARKRQSNLQQQGQLELHRQQLQQRHRRQQQQQRPTSWRPSRTHNQQTLATGPSHPSQASSQAAPHEAYPTRSGGASTTNPYQAASTTQAPKPQQGQAYNFRQSQHQQQQRQQHDNPGPYASSQSDATSQSQQHPHDRVGSSGRAAWPTAEPGITRRQLPPGMARPRPRGHTPTHTPNARRPRPRTQLPPVGNQPYQAAAQQPPLQQDISNGPQFPNTQTSQWHQQPGYQQQPTWNVNNTGRQQQQ